MPQPPWPTPGRYVLRCDPTNIAKPEKLKEAQKLTPVILLHAMLCTKEIWEKHDIPQKIANGTGRTVYYDDAPCHGVKYDAEEFSFRAICEDLDRMMNYIRIEKAILIGHSMGGKAAILAALTNPDMVEQLFIVDMHVEKIEEELINRSIHFMEEWRNCVQYLNHEFTNDDCTSESLRILYSKLPSHMKTKSEEMGFRKSRFIYKRQFGKCDVSYNVEALRRGLENYRESEEQLFNEYNEPSYFLYGTASPHRVWEKEEEIKKYFPKAEMIRFDGASHHLFVDDDIKFVNIIVEKLGQFV